VVSNKQKGIIQQISLLAVHKVGAAAISSRTIEWWYQLPFQGTKKKTYTE